MLSLTVCAGQTIVASSTRAGESGKAIDTSTTIGTRRAHAFIHVCNNIRNVVAQTRFLFMYIHCFAISKWTTYL